jgi:hypothetical protein
MAAEHAPGLLGEIRGVSDTPVRVVAEGKLGALVSEVPLAEFGDEPLAVNLHDPEWLEAGARGHDAVLAAAVQETSVVPFRFGTIYRSEEQVRALLVGHAGLVAALDSIAGRIEIGVKGFVREDAASEEHEPHADVSAGRRYLEEKQRARRAAEEREALAARAADESHRRLASFADDARANPLQPAEVLPPRATMFLNGAYLVRAEHLGAFRDAVASLEQELGASGVSFELTGPWPPYNFVEVDT